MSRKDNDRAAQGGSIAAHILAFVGVTLLAAVVLLTAAGLIFFLMVLFNCSAVLLCSNPQHRFKGLYYFLFLYISWTAHHSSEFDSSCSLYNNIIATFYIKLSRCKKINFPCCPESYPDYFCHPCQFSFIVSKSSSIASSRLTFAFILDLALSRPSRMFSIPS